MADSKIFELAHHFRIESEQQFESNLEASQVPMLLGLFFGGGGHCQGHQIC